MANWGYRDYVPASVKKARMAKSLEKLKKKNPNLAPIQISGTKIARTWWGIAWNNNLERYADYSNRIDRGRSYLRNGAVLDLKIEPGRITGLVQGSTVRPYQVEIQIQPLRQEAWSAVSQACAGSIQSLQDLVEGRFPKPLAELFTAKGSGLFPTPREIGFACSCPDYADMCKHVAAILYGVGARLDQDPTLFFVLRQVNIGELITQALNQTTGNLLARSTRHSSRTLADDDLSGLFGIDILEPAAEIESVAAVDPEAAVTVNIKPRTRKAVATRKPKTDPVPVPEAAAVPAQKTEPTMVEKATSAEVVKPIPRKVRKTARKIVRKAEPKTVRKTTKKPSRVLDRESARESIKESVKQVVKESVMRSTQKSAARKKADKVEKSEENLPLAPKKRGRPRRELS